MRLSVIFRHAVHKKNHCAIGVYSKAGYQEFGRYAHYEDRGHALRFEKELPTAHSA
jgi:hypothetical protein